MTVPPAVYAIWWTGLIVTLVVFVPLAVYLLRRTWRAARSIERYAAEARVAVDGIARNTSAVPALDTTIQVAAEMVGLAAGVERKLDGITTGLAERAR